MENIILTTTTRQSLVKDIALEVLTGLDSRLEQLHKPKAPIEYLTGKEVESILKISTQTRYDWGRKGILKPYKIGTRKRYKHDDVCNALKALETQNS